MINTREISSTWMHFEWWCFLRTIYLQRVQCHASPLKVTWIPAHVLENLPCELISHKLAIQHKTTWTDIFCNRQADKYAKCACGKNKQINASSFDEFCEKVGKWQKWLALVSSAIANRDNDSDEYGEADQGCQVEPVQCSISPGELTLAHPISYFEAVLPKWFWTSPGGSNWKCDFPGETSLKSYAVMSQHDWGKAISFFQSIEWVLNDQYKTSFLELAYMSWENGFIFHKGTNPAECATLLRKCINQATKYHNTHRLIPGEISCKAKSNGKTFPAGMIIGAFPVLQSVTLKRIAIHFFNGRSQNLKSWKHPF